MNDDTPVATPSPAPWAGPDEAFQLDRATLAATGWNPVLAQPQHAQPQHAQPLIAHRPAPIAHRRALIAHRRALIADRLSGRGATPSPAVSVALLNMLIIVTWVVLVGRSQPAVASAPTSTRPAVVSVARCMPASARLVGDLKRGITAPEYRELRDVSVVKSRDHAAMYFVAGAVAGTGWGAKVGLWATADPSGGAPIYSINGTARAVSGWPAGMAIDARPSELDDGADVAMACADG
jgi:hypothetical protein